MIDVDIQQLRGRRFGEGKVDRASWISPGNCSVVFFFFQAEDGIRDVAVTGVQTCALPIFGVTVPSGATTGNVVVNTSGVASNGVNFTVLPTPSITNLSVMSGAVGTPVTITGTNFGSTQGSSTVTFNGTATTPTNWSATSITVPVPSGATTGNVVVNAGGAASNGVAFTVLPGITSLSPTTGAVGVGSDVAVTG